MTELTESSTNPVACRREPNRWLDPDERTRTLPECLRCPARRGCAQRALATRAPYGQWAGIWLNGRHSEPEVRYLEAIANDRPLDPRTFPADTRAPVLIDSTKSVEPSPAALVLARSSGNCEIMGYGCRLTCDVLMVRSKNVLPVHAPSAAALFASCAACQTDIMALDSRKACRLGYLADPEMASPFFWRQTRWVIFTAEGRLRATRPAAA